MKNQVFNPFLSSYEYIPDSEPHVFGDKIYIYGSHDKFDGNSFCLNDYVCYWANVDDLTNWHYGGIIYKKTDDPRSKNYNLNLYAPDVCQGKDGKYYLYYTFGGNGIVGVAVCNTPCGKYEFLGFIQYENGNTIGTNKGDVYLFDPSIFIDTDGKIFLYSGFATTTLRKIKSQLYRKLKADGGYVVELEDDMITAKHTPKKILPSKTDNNKGNFKGHEFFEASSMRKIGNTYYLIYSSNQMHELCYATSNYPDKDFVFKGTVISNANIVENNKKDAVNYYSNNHGGMVNIKDKWYIFYHRHTNLSQFNRQAMAQEITFDSDNNIVQAEVTSDGLNNGPLNGKGYYPAYIACELYKGKHATLINHPFIKLINPPYLTQDKLDGEICLQYIKNITTNCVVGYKYFDFDSVSHVSLTVKGNYKGKIIITTNLYKNQNTKLININCQKYETIKYDVNITNGKYPLYFKFIGKGILDFESFNIE